MNRTTILRISGILLLLATLCHGAFAQGSFEPSSAGMRYVVRDGSGQIVQNIKAEFDSSTGNYVVKDENKQVIAVQPLAPEADMTQIKIVAPLNGDTHSAQTRDYLGNPVPVLRELPANDVRYQQLKSYIENDPGLGRTMAMQLEARNMKIEKLQGQLNEGIRDPKLVSWLTNDLKKPVYLEVGDNGNIYHDPKGFVMAETGPDGQVAYRDNSYVNRIVIPPNSEAFQGGMNDSSAASVMAHEMGHMIMDQTYERNNYPKTTYAGPHSKDAITDQGFAISEGWAEAVETLANKERLDTASSWRIQSQKNIADNKYIFKNQEVLDGPNDGILKTGAQMLSTEGVNASLFYKMLQDNRIQAPYSKVLQVFEQSKPQTYNDFLKNYIDAFPEDRSHVIGQYLENTKYATVDSSAVNRYKALHDAEQAYLSAPADQPELKSQLENQYQQQKSDYDQWKEQAYKQTVVDGKIDRAVGGDSAVSQYSDATGKQYKQIKLSETILKSQKALGQGFQNAADSIKQSFSVKSMAMTAGTTIAMNLANQIFTGEKVSFKKAFSAVASLQFVGNVVGSTLGAASGQVFAPLIRTFVPIPIVGTLAGALLPTLGSIIGGNLGSNIGAGMAIKTAFKNLDYVAIAGQAIGSTIGTMIGAMIPIPVLGPMIGGMLGGILGEKLFKGIAKLFGRDKKPAAQTGTITMPTAPQNYTAPAAVAPSPPKEADEARLDPSVEKIPYGQMPQSIRAAKEDYERAYREYVQAVSAGNKLDIQAKLNVFIGQKNRYRFALQAYSK